VKRKTVLATISILLSLTVGLLLAEFALHFLAPPWLSQRMHEINLNPSAIGFGSDAGWSVESIDGKFVRFTPNTKFPVNYYEYKTSANIDRWGGRVVASDALAKNPKAFVPFLGDSFTFGIGVEDAETYISILSARFPVPFLNLGVPGSALPQHLDILQYRHRELHSPSVYVFNFFTGNDYFDMIRYYSKQERSERRSPLGQFLDRTVYSNRFFAKSYLLQLIKVQFFMNPANQKPPSPNRYRSWFTVGNKRKPVESSIYLIMSGNEKYIAEVTEYTKMAVHRLVQMSHEMQFKPLFIIIPDKHQADPDFFERQAAYYGMDTKDLDINRPERIIEEQLEANHIPYIDLLPCLKGRTGLYYDVDDHFKPGGHRFVANCLARDLNTMLTSLLK